MSRESIGIGVIGCGRIANLRHLPLLATLDGARPVAVADPLEERARDTAGRFSVPRRYDGHDALLADPRVRAVVVCTPARQHAEIALAALDAGKHVLLEKPVALELADADRLSARAAATDLCVLVGYNLRWHRLVRRARALLAAGAIGEPQALRTVFSTDFAYRDTVGPWRLAREAGGGVIFELGTHHFDLWAFLLGDEVVEATAVVHSEQGEDDVGAAVCARTARGTLLSAAISQRSAQAQEVDVLGSEGRLQLGGYRFDGLQVTPADRAPGGAGAYAGGALRFLRELPAGVRAARRGGDFVESYRHEWRHFLRAIRGEEEPGCTLADGRQALAVTLAALDAADTGRTVAVDRATTPIGVPA